MVYKLENTMPAERLFDNWEEGVIWGCLQNVMGEIYADDKDNPTSAMAVLGDFCYFAGEGNEALLRFQPDKSRDFIIMVPQNEEWAKLIESTYKDNAKKTTRYAMKKEGDIFDRDKLKKAVSSLDKKYEIKMIDEVLYDECFKEEWSRDFVSQYKTYEQYKMLGMGVAILRNKKLVAAASSYSSFKNGIEIEIGTKEAYRRNGLAYICGAKLILECLNRGWYPSWDARIIGSVKLAEKLGYHFDHAYVAYDVFR